VPLAESAAGAARPAAGRRTPAKDPGRAGAAPATVSLAAGPSLVVDLGGVRRTLSSAVLGGGLARARAWLNVTVPPDYARTDPAADLAERAAALALASPVVGMLTAVDVADHHQARRGGATAFATVGVRHALAPAGTRPRPLAAGTINLLVVVDAPLTDAGLAGAAQTAIEAKAQALAATGIEATNAPGPATGTATDAFCIAALPGATVPFAGPATRTGGDIAHAVFAAVREGAAVGQGSTFGQPATASAP
jgi:adenosylcobinamide hydrolase